MKLKHIIAVTGRGCRPLRAFLRPRREVLLGSHPRYVLHLARKHLCRALPSLHPLEMVHRCRPVVPPGADHRRDGVPQARQRTGITAASTTACITTPGRPTTASSSIPTTVRPGGISRALEAKVRPPGGRLQRHRAQRRRQGRPHQPAECHHGLLLHARPRLFRRHAHLLLGGRRPVRPQHGARDLPPISKPCSRTPFPPWRRNPRSGLPEDGYIKQAAAAALLAQLYFNAEAYIGEEHFDECAADLPRHHRRCLRHLRAGQDTWYGPHTFRQQLLARGDLERCLRRTPRSSGTGISNISTIIRPTYISVSRPPGYNGFMLTPSLNPAGDATTRSGNWAVPTSKFNDKDLRKKPYRYLGSQRIRRHVPRRRPGQPQQPFPSSAWDRRSIAAR